MKATQFLFAIVAALTLMGSAAFAKTIVLKKNIQMTPSEGNHYWAVLSFDETDPGNPNGSITGTGCDIFVEGTESVFKAGSYTVTHENSTSPSVWDKRWYRSFTSEENGESIAVDCKTHSGFLINPISKSYVKKVTGGFVIIQ